MREFSFEMGKELFGRNSAEFTRKVLRYRIDYSVAMLDENSVKVTVKGDDLTRLCLVVGILNKDE